MPLPFDLAHRLAEAVEDLRVDVDVAERHLAHVVQARDHHARHPERDDVAAGHQHAGRVVVRQLRRLLRPAERRVRPERGAEPGVEDVGVLRETAILQQFFSSMIFSIDRGRHTDQVAILSVG